LLDEYSLENPLIHSSPDSKEPIKHSLIKIMTYQNDTYLRHSGNPTWRIMSQICIIREVNKISADAHMPLQGRMSKKKNKKKGRCSIKDPRNPSTYYQNI
jgi:V8-like Glu-specific endopeptidase